MEAIAVELIRLLPDLLWFCLALGLVAAFWQPIRNDLLPNLANLKAGGMELSFVREAMDRAIELAEKSPKWQVDVPQGSKEQVLRRARRHLSLLSASAVLWVDDDHSNNRNEVHMLRQLKVEVETVSTTAQALALLGRDKFDIVLSDIARGGDARAGLAMLPLLKERHQSLPVIFYVGELRSEFGVPGGAFGITNRPDELLHLILDALERVRG
jgi:CheY-like chemotaxis protein